MWWYMNQKWWAVWFLYTLMMGGVTTKRGLGARKVFGMDVGSGFFFLFP
jgi:hypothetical protein